MSAGLKINALHQGRRPLTAGNRGTITLLSSCLVVRMTLGRGGSIRVFQLGSQSLIKISATFTEGVQLLGAVYRPKEFKTSLAFK